LNGHLIRSNMVNDLDIVENINSSKAIWFFFKSHIYPINRQISPTVKKKKVWNNAFLSRKNKTSIFSRISKWNTNCASVDDEKKFKSWF
jgi:hypothetical protein